MAVKIVSLINHQQDKHFEEEVKKRNKANIKYKTEVQPRIYINPWSILGQSFVPTHAKNTYLSSTHKKYKLKSIS